jgi:hypothetical protein
MSFVCGLAFILLVNVSAIRPVARTQESPVERAWQARTLEISGTTVTPKWVTRIPENHFVGISKVCQSIEDARQRALGSAIGQILQAMGAEYTLNHTSILAGNENHAHHDLNEKLTYSAKWFMRSVQQTVIESNIQEVADGYVCFVLLNFPPAKIKKLRQLSIGPKVGAGVLKMTTDGIWIEVRENNGVQVTLTDYQIEMATENRHADLITLFAWKVPKHSVRNFERILDQNISVKNNSQTFLIRKPPTGATFKNLLLGAKTHLKILLHGYDEMGRQVLVTVKEVRDGISSFHRAAFLN